MTFAVDRWYRLAPRGEAGLARFADLEKRGEVWQDQAWRGEPRVPKRRTGGGQWTTDGVDATDAAAARGTAPAHPYRSAERRPDLPDWIEVYRRPAAALARA